MHGLTEIQLINAGAEDLGYAADLYPGEFPTQRHAIEPLQQRLSAIGISRNVEKYLRTYDAEFSRWNNPMITDGEWEARDWDRMLDEINANRM